MKVKFLGLLTCLALTSLAVAENQNVATVMSADSIQTRHHGQESLLKGKVKIAFGRRVTITGNEILVMYADAKKQEVSELIIYGAGLLQNGDHTTRFRNGLFKVKTSEFSAERMSL